MEAFVSIREEEEQKGVKIPSPALPGPQGKSAQEK